MKVHCEGCWEHTCICLPKKKSNLATKVAQLELQMVALETQLKAKSTKCPHSCPYNTDVEYFGT